MSAPPRVPAARRTGQILTGLGALLILLGVLVGAPVALLALAGNPLPDRVPGLDEIAAVLTSRDDGRLFIRALAILGWLGWASFALSVLVEIPARILRRPAIRLPGLRRQQRWAATLLGSVVLMVAAGPAMATAATVAASPGSTAAVAVSANSGVDVSPSVPAVLGVSTSWGGPSTTAVGVPDGESAPVYRVEKGDYLGHIAGRYLGDFDRYRELAELNKIGDPDRIRAGQTLHLPSDAQDRGVRPHATGQAAFPVPIDEPPGGQPNAPTPPPTAEPAPVAPPTAEPADRSGGGGTGGAPTYAVGAARAPEVNQLNRPLAVSAVISVASIIGAQLGALVGLRRRPAPADRSSIEIGRHRRNPE